jgi:ribosomal protein L28
VAKVKDGFVPRIREEIFRTLKALQTAKCPFKNLPENRVSRWGESLTAEKMSQCCWVTPKLVCQIAFVEWTDAGHLRHCSFVANAMTKSLRRWFVNLETIRFGASDLGMTCAITLSNFSKCIKVRRAWHLPGRRWH